MPWPCPRRVCVVFHTFGWMKKTYLATTAMFSRGFFGWLFVTTTFVPWAFHSHMKSALTEVRYISYWLLPFPMICAIPYIRIVTLLYLFDQVDGRWSRKPFWPAKHLVYMLFWHQIGEVLYSIAIPNWLSSLQHWKNSRIVWVSSKCAGFVIRVRLLGKFTSWQKRTLQERMLSGM